MLESKVNDKRLKLPMLLLELKQLSSERYSLLRSGSLCGDGPINAVLWHFSLEIFSLSLKFNSDVVNNDGDLLNLLKVLAKDVGVIDVFSDCQPPFYFIRTAAD